MGSFSYPVPFPLPYAHSPSIPSAPSLAFGLRLSLPSSLANHLGTPSLSTTSPSGWALDGFCDSLAYEIALFNIKISIVQPNLEVNILTNTIVAAPTLPAYDTAQKQYRVVQDQDGDGEDVHNARALIGSLIDRLKGPSTSGRGGLSRRTAPTQRPPNSNLSGSTSIQSEQEGSEENIERLFSPFQAP